MKQLKKLLLGCNYAIAATLCCATTTIAQTPLTTISTNSADVYPVKVCNTLSCPGDSMGAFNTPACLNADAITVKRNTTTNHFTEPSTFGVGTGFTELWGITYSDVTVDGGSLTNHSGFTIGTYFQFPSYFPNGRRESFANPLPHPLSVLTTANDPDIALTTIPLPGGGYQHVALVVYESGGDIYLEQYPVFVDRTGKVWSSLLGPCGPCYPSYQSVPISNTGNCSKPHIDIWHLAGGSSNGSATLGQYYAVTWQADNAGTMEVWGADGTPDLVTTNSAFIIDADGKEPDVAAVASVQGLVTHRAFVSHLTNSGKTLHVSTWDYGSTTISGPYIINSPMTANNDELATPRIAGPMYYDFVSPTPSDPFCTIVVNNVDANFPVPTVIDKVSAYKLYDASFLSPGPVIRNMNMSDYNSADGFASNGYTAIMPVVTGVGEVAFNLAVAPAYPDYPVAFYSEYEDVTRPQGTGGSGEFYVFGVPLDINDSLPYLSGGTYMEMNYNAPVDALPTWNMSDRPALAISTSHNSGHNLLTTFYAGNAINQITMSFDGSSLGPYNFKPGRTTGINKVDKNGYAVYPNPVNNVLNIAQADGAKYIVTDAVGRTLNAGTLQGNKAQVNTTSLTPGMYILHISKDGHAEKVKFVKQ